MSDLFDAPARRRAALDAPLAERLRPETLDEVVGQEKVLGSGRLLRRLVESDRPPSVILWGPPGTGKTTVARLIAKATKAHFASLSAVLSGVAELRQILKEAEQRRREHGERTILFIDEIHRWSKSQQDALLDAVERGLVSMIGATTENPSFELNAALLSRARVVVFQSLEDADIETLLARAMSSPRGFGGRTIEVEPQVFAHIAAHSFGDARRALTVLELAVRNAELAGTPVVVTMALAEEAMQHRALPYDKAGEAHYAVTSAFIKSMRGSDPDAAVYYLVRMLESGEDPRFILRRMVIFASEDIGQADPSALGTAVAALHAFELVGLPEGVLPLTQAVLHLANAPKSNTALTTYTRARKDVLERGPLPVPAKLQNAVTKLDASLEKGAGYRYPHDLGGLVPGETYLPDALVGRRYYTPTENGAERDVAERLRTIRKPSGDET